MRRILDAKAEVEEDDAAEGAIVLYMKLTKLMLILALEMTCGFTAQATVLDDLNVETVRFGLSYLVANDRLGKADCIFSGRDGAGSVIVVAIPASRPSDSISRRRVERGPGVGQRWASRMLPRCPDPRRTTGSSLHQPE